MTWQDLFTEIQDHGVTPDIAMRARRCMADDLPPPKSGGAIIDAIVDVLCAIKRAIDAIPVTALTPHLSTPYDDPLWRAWHDKSASKIAVEDGQELFVLSDHWSTWVHQEDVPTQRHPDANGVLVDCVDLWVADVVSAILKSRASTAAQLRIAEFLRRAGHDDNLRDALHAAALANSLIAFMHQQSVGMIKPQGLTKYQIRALNEKTVSVRELAVDLGVSPSTVSRWRQHTESQKD